jgi:hypothetical protein
MPAALAGVGIRLLLDGGLGGMPLTEIAVTDPYVKGYDAIEGAGPQCWLGALRPSNWDSSAPAGPEQASAAP